MRTASRSRRRSTSPGPRAPPVEGEATFVVGNPGSTQRLLTQDQLAFAKEVSAPLNVAVYSELRGRLIAAMAAEPGASA